MSLGKLKPAKPWTYSKYGKGTDSNRMCCYCLYYVKNNNFTNLYGVYCRKINVRCNDELQELLHSGKSR